MQIFNKLKEPNFVKPSTYVMVLYLLILPLDSYLGEIYEFGFFGFLTITFIVLRIVESIKTKCEIKAWELFIYSVYFVLSGMAYIKNYNGTNYNLELYLLMAVTIFAFLVASPNKEEIKTLLKTAPYSLFLLLLAITLTITKSEGEVFFMIKLIVDPNYLITNMVFVLAVCIHFIYTEKKIVVKVLIAVEILLLFVYTFFIGTRGGLVSIGVVALFSVLIHAKHKVRAILILAAAGAAVVVLAILFVPSDVLKRFTIENILSNGGSGRTTIWSNYLEMYKNLDWYNWIFGVGKDVPPQMYLDYYGRVYYAHNIYVRLLLEGGIVGELLLWWVLFKASKSYAKKAPFMLAGLLGFCVGALFLDLDNMRVFWIIMMFAAAYSQIKPLEERYEI